MLACSAQPRGRSSGCTRYVAARAHSRREALWTGVASTGMLLGAARPAAAKESVADFTVQQFSQDVSMSKYEGQVLVVVNVASE